MPAARHIPIGTRFGRLEVIEDSISLQSGNRKRRYFKCRCDCGNEKTIVIDSLLSGNSNSCGCLRKEIMKEKFTTHGMSKHKIFYSLYDMNSRCNKEIDTGYHHYGAKGITVCERWHWDNPTGLDNFVEDMLDSWFEGATIDRIVGSGNYEPINCRWLTIGAQNRNIGMKKTNTSGFKGVGRYVTGNNEYFRANWTDLDGKGKTKSFSIKKYGEELAELMAIEYRIQQMLLLNLQGAGYSDYHIYGREQI